jgi:hypothetical protein
MLDALPDELVVLIAAMLMESEASMEKAAFVLGAASRRTRDLFKAAMARSAFTLHVSGCASAAACIAAFPDAPSLAIEAQVTAPMLAAVVRNKMLRDLCVGAVLTRSERSTRSLMRALAATGLRSLDVTMRHTESIGLLASLERLTMLASNARSASCVAGLTRLRVLELASCHGLSDLAPIAALSSLTRLSVSYCSRVHDISPVGSLASLVELSIVSPTARLRGIERLTSLGSLRVLRIRRATISARTVARLTTLESLTIQCAWPVTALSALSALRALTSLDYEYDGASGAWGPNGPTGAWGPNGPTGLTGLTGLRLCRVPASAIEGLASLVLLQELRLSDVRKLRALPDFPASLRVLSVSRCPSLTDTGSICALSGLRDLSLTSCGGLRLERLERLERLDIACDTIDLQILVGLRSLRKLTVWAVNGVHGLEHTRAMPALTELSVGSFPTTTDAVVAAIHELAARTGMTSVNLTGCNPELVENLTAGVVTAGAALRLYPPA